MRLWFALALVLAVSACVQNAPKAVEAPGVHAAAVVPRFSEPMKITDLRNGEAETFVAVSKDGQQVITCLHGEFKEPSMMYASLDGGATFTELHATPSPMSGGDCEVAMGDDGTWYFMHSTVADGTVVSTSDQGKTWRINYNAAPPINGLADRPWLETVGPDVVLSYMPLFSNPGPIASTKSTDQGATWSQPQRVNAPPPTMPNSINGHMTVSPDGQTVRIPIVEYAVAGTPGTQTLVRYIFATSHDRGATWTEQPVLGPFQSYEDPPAVAAAADGSLYYSYRIPADGKQDLMFVRSTDNGSSWSEPTRLFSGFTNVGWDWMDARPDGTVDLLVQGDLRPIDPKVQPDSHIGLIRIDARRPDLIVFARVLDVGEGEFISMDHDGAGHVFITYLHASGSQTATDQLYILRELPS